MKDIFTSSYDPSDKEKLLAEAYLRARSSLGDKEWYKTNIPDSDIPEDFVSWFRATCSQCFGYDLEKATVTDELIKDLRMFKGTWGDVDMDVLEAFEERFMIEPPTDAELKSVLTFGDFLRVLWKTKVGPIQPRLKQIHSPTINSDKDECDQK